MYSLISFSIPCSLSGISCTTSALLPPTTDPSPSKPVEFRRRPEPEYNPFASDDVPETAHRLEVVEVWQRYGTVRFDGASSISTTSAVVIGAAPTLRWALRMVCLGLLVASVDAFEGAYAGGGARAPYVGAAKRRSPYFALLRPD